jgi:hypothetical protein
VEFLPDNGHAVPRESGETMTRRPRRNHTPAFKAKVALAAVKVDRRPILTGIQSFDPGTVLPSSLHWELRAQGLAPIAAIRRL